MSEKCYIYFVNYLKPSLFIVKKIFNDPKPNYYRYLYITVLEDVGKYFPND